MNDLRELVQRAAGDEAARFTVADIERRVRRRRRARRSVVLATFVVVAAGVMSLVTVVDRSAPTVVAGEGPSAATTGGEEGPDCGSSGALTASPPLDHPSPALAASAFLHDLEPSLDLIDSNSPSAPVDQPTRRCEVRLVDASTGLAVTARVSGSAGAYVINGAEGFTIDGPASIEAGTPDGPSLSVSVQHQDVAVGLGYWCDTCTTGSMHLDYGDDLSTSATTTGADEEFRARLPHPPPASSVGRLFITITTETDQPRALVLRALPGGDFAAG